MARQAFEARIFKVGINPCVAVPGRVSRAFARRGYAPVKGTLNRFPIQATLVPVGGGRHRLYLNTEMRRGAGVEVGDTVRVSIQIDPGPREVPVPPELAGALRKDKTAARAFAALIPSHRRDYLLYLNWLKTPEALERNVSKVIAELRRSPRTRRRRRGSLLARPANSQNLRLRRTASRGLRR